MAERERPEEQARAKLRSLTRASASQAGQRAIREERSPLPEPGLLQKPDLGQVEKFLERQNWETKGEAAAAAAAGGVGGRRTERQGTPGAGRH